jgi:nicotinamide N-methyltransferase
VGYDIVILSDLLHFHSCHDVLMASLKSLLAKRGNARGYVAAGKYTSSHVCDHFLRMGDNAGLHFEEGGPVETQWLGTLEVSGLNSEQLGVRKGMCRFWVCRWKEFDN